MSRAGRSVLVFGVYLTFLGAVLVVAPNALLGVFGFPAASDVWIRVVGVLVLCLAFYYMQAGRRGFGEFFGWTVYARGFVFVSFATFVLLELASPMLALFGVVDLSGAVWTAVTLRRARAA